MITKDRYETKQLQIHKKIGGKKVGDVVDVKTDNGIIQDPYWRNRYNDSTIDGCVSFVNPVPETKSDSGKKKFNKKTDKEA